MENKIRPTNHDLKIRVAIWSASTGIPQYKLAEELGISSSLLSLILNGRRSGQAYLKKIKKLTRSLEIA